MLPWMSAFQHDLLLALAAPELAADQPAMSSTRVPEAVVNECLALIFQMQVKTRAGQPISQCTRWCAAALLIKFARRLDTIEAECTDSPERILNASSVLQPDRSDCLFLTLVLLWMGSKMFETHQISTTELKACASRIVSDKVYTAKDFAKAEIELLEAINFEFDTGRSCPVAMEDLLKELRRVSRVGDLIKLSTCYTIYTFLHSDPTLRQQLGRTALPASIIVVAYLISVPKKQALFPVLQWVCAMNKQDQDEVQGFTRLILQSIIA